jgi:hypothetical protein
LHVPARAQEFRLGRGVGSGTFRFVSVRLTVAQVTQLMRALSLLLPGHRLRLANS